MPIGSPDLVSPALTKIGNQIVCTVLHDVDSTMVLAWREHLIGLELSNNSVANRLSAPSSLFRHLCKLDDKTIVELMGKLKEIKKLRNFSD